MRAALLIMIIRTIRQDALDYSNGAEGSVSAARSWQLGVLWHGLVGDFVALASTAASGKQI